jgi:hypothetical protein
VTCAQPATSARVPISSRDDALVRARDAPTL